MLFYISWADGNRPKGQQWLGAAFVDEADVPRTGAIFQPGFPWWKAPGIARAIWKTHKLGINPGGAAKAVRLDGVTDDERALLEPFMNRLLTKADLEAQDRSMGGSGKTLRWTG